MKGRTYRYLQKEPLYPFGYGLTYGKCVVTALKLAEAVDYPGCIGAGAKLCITVKNEGSVETEDVLQIYVHVEGTENEVPHPKLSAFRRLKLEPGREQTVEMTIPAAAFSTVNDLGERVFDGKGACIYAGFGQPDPRTAELTGIEGKYVIV